MKKTAIIIKGSPVVHVGFGTGRIQVSRSINPHTKKPMVTFAPIKQSAIGSDAKGKELDGTRVVLEFSSVKSTDVVIAALEAVKSKLIEDFIIAKTNEFTQNLEKEIEDFINT